jgi:hypothetical protein
MCSPTGIQQRTTYTKSKITNLGEITPIQPADKVQDFVINKLSANLRPWLSDNLKSTLQEFEPPRFISYLSFDVEDTL